MRISKLPEERKQEIMDTAMQVFSEKGYEQTTMRDIAAAVGVVPGLCYRYFASKQELFDAALQNYAISCCQPFIALLHSQRYNLDELLSEEALLHTVNEGSGSYQTFFHKKENENFHILLSERICQYMLPHITEVIADYNERYQLGISDTHSIAAFYLFGATAILNDKALTNQEKAAQIKEVTHKLMKPENHK